MVLNLKIKSQLINFKMKKGKKNIKLKIDMIKILD